MTEPDPRPEPVEGGVLSSPKGRGTRPADGPIVLVGPPSSGKSTVGRLLADRLGVEFVDVDELIEQRTGKLIGEIFATDGEPAFRVLETVTTLETITGPDADPARVISLGGGAVTSAEIRAALAGRRVVWLQVGIAAAAARIGLNTARPLLLGNVRGQLIKLMRQREPLYAEVATIALATDDREPGELVESIVAQL